VIHVAKIIYHIVAFRIPILLVCNCFQLAWGFPTCCLKVVPFVWYMAGATLPAGMVGKSRICCPFLPWCMWIFLVML
jgi:hypothetical protein